MASLLITPHKYPSPAAYPSPSSIASSMPPQFRRYSLSMSSSSMAKAKPERVLADGIEREASGVAILWFKHDLRIQDHPGLEAASKNRGVLPLYIFDHRILSRFSDEMVELLLLALQDLRKSLEEQGSNLMIRFGHSEHVMQELVKEVKATHIFAEEEAEYNIRYLVDIVVQTLVTDPSLDWGPKVISWRTPFYYLKKLEGMPQSHNDLEILQGSYDSLNVLPKLPNVNGALNWGNLPLFSEVKNFLLNCSTEREENWALVKETSDSPVLEEKVVVGNSSSVVNGELVLSESEGRSQRQNQIRQNKLKFSVFNTSEGNIVAGGATIVWDALNAYLRCSEGTVRDEWQEVHRRLQETECRSGASFGLLFAPALQLGIISRRRVYFEATKYENERNAGFSYATTTVAAAIETIRSMEWYLLLALKSQSREDAPWSVRWWRWNGYLVQYTVVGSDGPALLLVHGFGAFLEHYRDNFHDLADGGNRVWAITLLGFGKSEKPNIIYTELMWAELLRDFIIEVVHEPVHLIGNSFGGYLVAIVGGLWSSLVKSVVLINTAGNVSPRYASWKLSKERNISGAAWLAAIGLLQVLRFSLRSIVKSCYPTRTERADDWLIDEMLRASYDPGVSLVLESVFSLNLSIPLNHLLERLKEKVLVIQGMKDPIDNSNLKVAMFRKYCAWAVIKELDAGHCPHDERPEEVNPLILDWVATIESRTSVGSFY